MIKDLLNHIVGNATELSKEEIEESFHHVLFEGEEPHIAFKLYRDKWLFTNKRLIMLDIQGVTGTKKEYHTIPYKSIYHFAVETAGSIDFDSEIKIWVAGTTSPIVKELKKGIDVIGLQKTLAYHICNK